jgi:hypothetical protein
VIYGVEMLVHAFMSVPTLAPNEKADFTTSEFSGILVMIFLAHIVGLFFGLLVAKRIEKESSMPLFFVSLSMIVGSLVNIAMVPHPLWFSLMDPIGLLTITFLVYRWKTKSVS